ncbi:MAG: DUF4390 domain-containing protein [Methylococcales bacterium]
MNRIGICFVLFFYGVPVGQAADYGFSIQKAEVVPARSSHVLNADIDYRFSPRAADALAHGVPLTLVVKVRVNRYRRFFWNKTVFSKKLVYRLRYHALRKRYQVYDEVQGGNRYFSSLPATVEAMGKIRGLTVLGPDEFRADARYEAKLKASLDIEALPLPLRSIAYLIPQWYMSSGWYSWSLETSSRP